MDMLRGPQIAEADLTDWRKLAQGLHARYLVDDFEAAARFVAAIATAGNAVGHHPRVRIADGVVDLELVTDDAVYRDEDGTAHSVEWVTQQDVDLARKITDLAAAQGLRPDPAAVSEIELGLDTAAAADIAPVWAALLTGGPDSIGRGTPGSDEIRDATVRVPNLWFDDTEPQASGQRFHIEVYVAPEVAEQRLQDVLAAGGIIEDGIETPGITVVTDPDGNKGVLCYDVSAAAGGGV